MGTCFVSGTTSPAIEHLQTKIAVLTQRFSRVSRACLGKMIGFSVYDGAKNGGGFRTSL